MQEYDNQLRIGLENIQNRELDGQSWQQSVLPVKDGGLVIRLTTEVALLAFLLSAHATVAGANSLLPGDVRDEVYQDLEKAKSSWKEIIPDSSLQPTDKTVKAFWDTPL